MLEVEQIEHDLIGFISKNILAENVTIEPETPFKDIGMDSYSIIETVLFIERKFGIAIPDNQLNPDNLQSVRSLANCTINLQKSL